MSMPRKMDKNESPKTTIPGAREEIEKKSGIPSRLFESKCIAVIRTTGKPTPKISESGSRRISFMFLFEKVKALIFPPPFR